MLPAAAIMAGVLLSAGNLQATARWMSGPAPPAAQRVPGPAAVKASGLAVAGALSPLPGGPTGPAHPAPRSTRSAVPVRLIIPAIGVDTALEPLGLLSDHTLQPPSRWDTAGWYADGVRPGDAGPAVIAGHVDSTSGPAVFYRLRDLHRGDVVLIRQRTGRTVRFAVDTIETYPKDRFPTARVYGPRPLPELRLITCTGDFDTNAHSYLDNLVVTGLLVT
jgi:sortase (surface protein transpeptidase)